MIRTQVSLNEEEYRLAKHEAKRLGLSLAELLRRSLRHLLPHKTDKPWMKFCGDVTTGNPQSSQEIDEIVYGLKK